MWKPPTAKRSGTPSIRLAGIRDRTHNRFTWGHGGARSGTGTQRKAVLKHGGELQPKMGSNHRVVKGMPSRTGHPRVHPVTGRNLR